MYETFYGLRERPFDLTPNPRFLLLTGKHREALSNLQYGLVTRRALTLLVGDAGTGKTTLVRAVVGEIEKRGGLIAYLNNPTLTRQEFYEFLAGAFGLDATGASKVRLLEELGRVLQDKHDAGIVTGLVIDEAQGLPDELLEEVRLLANIETATDKLLPVVLAGQPELADRLNGIHLRQLKQRVALRCQLGSLSPQETAEYVAGRIRIAGGNNAIVFTRQAVDAIFEHSGGIPRLISVICDNALISGFAADRRPVSRDIVEDVCRDFDLPKRNGTPVRHMVEQAAIGTPMSAAAGSGSPALRAQPEGPATPPAASASTGSNAPVEMKKDRPPQSRGMFEHFTVRRRFSFF